MTDLQVAHFIATFIFGLALFAAYWAGRRDGARDAVRSLGKTFMEALTTEPRP